jgi:hypothetical protein
MIRCTFHLNGYQLSTLSCPGIGFFPAYSGNAGVNRNNPNAIAAKKVGPLPPGNYYIVSRPRGGFRSLWQDMIHGLESGSDRDLWFALYRKDRLIDDMTFIEGVERGHFRLHPAGKSGISDGCITLPNHSDYAILLQALLSTPSMMVSSQLKAFGTIQVY